MALWSISMEAATSIAKACVSTKIHTALDTCLKWHKSFGRSQTCRSTAIGKLTSLDQLGSHTAQSALAASHTHGLFGQVPAIKCSVEELVSKAQEKKSVYAAKQISGKNARLQGGRGYHVLALQSTAEPSFAHQAWIVFTCQWD